MAEQKTTARVSTEIKPVPITERPQVGIASVTVKPSPIAELVNPIVGTLAKLADQQKAGGPSRVNDVVRKVMNMGQADMQQLSDSGNLNSKTYAGVRDRLYSNYLQLASDLQLTAEEQKSGFTQIGALSSNVFGQDRVKQVLDPATGINTVSVDGDVLGSYVDTEAAQATYLAQIKETIGSTQATTLAFGLEGKNADGSVSQNPEKTKTTAAEYLYTLVNTLGNLSQTKFQTDIQKATIDFKQAGIDHTALVAREEQGTYSAAFTKLSSGVLSNLMTENGGQWLKGPPEAAIAEYKSRIVQLAQATEFQEYKLKLNQPDFYDNMIAKHVEIATGLLSGKNIKVLSQYRRDYQESAMKVIANDAVLGMGTSAVAAYGNSEAFQQLVSASVISAGFSNLPGAAETPIGAALQGLISGQSIGSVEGRLTQMQPITNPADMTGDINWLVGEMRGHMKGLTGIGPATGLNYYGAMRLLKEIESSPAVDRWLRSKEVDPKLQKGFIETINQWEQVLIDMGITPADMEELNNKKYKPNDIFTQGLPTD